MTQSTSDGAIFKFAVRSEVLDNIRTAFPAFHLLFWAATHCWIVDWAVCV